MEGIVLITLFMTAFCIQYGSEAGHINKPCATCKPALSSAYPFIMPIYRISTHGAHVGYRNFICSGALIHPRIILSAGHCVHYSPPNATCDNFWRCEPWQFYTSMSHGSSSNLAASRAYMPISEIYVATEKYDPCKLVDDLSILVLSKPISHKFFESTKSKANSVALASLPNDTSSISRILDNLKLRSAGWGKVEFSNPEHGMAMSWMRTEQFTVVPYKTCQDSWITWQIPPANKAICTEAYTGKDTCQGDSGTPLWMEQESGPTIFGVLSYGNDKCGQRSPTVPPAIWTDIRAYLPWIGSIFNKVLSKTAPTPDENPEFRSFDE